MSAFTNDELIDYVLEAPTARVAEIEQCAAADDELAAQIAVMRLMCGRPVSFAKRSRLACRGPFRRAARLCAQHSSRILRLFGSAAFVALLAGAVWASWSYKHRPLLEDHFQRRTFDSAVWSAPRPQLRPEMGYIRLANRGYLVTHQEFEGPIELSFRWRWLDLVENPLYSDDLTVVLRTNGEPKAERPYEIKDGVSIRFGTYDRMVMIGPPQPSPDGLYPKKATPRGGVPMVSDAWHDVRITDDGTTISVFICGPELAPANATKPVLQVAWPQEYPGGKIAFYNREKLAFTPHESHITDVVVRRLEH